MDKVFVLYILLLISSIWFLVFTCVLIRVLCIQTALKVTGVDLLRDWHILRFPVHCRDFDLRLYIVKVVTILRLSPSLERSSTMKELL